MRRISFIIPLYNQERFIHECLDSILSVDIPHDEYEVIVWNDGSTDNSANIVCELQNTHSNIILVNEVNKGVSSARNNALKVARGNYVWFVDSDDLLNTEKIRYILEYAEGKSVDMVYLTWKAWDGKKCSDGVHIQKDSNEVVSGRQAFIHNRYMMAPWCFIYRRKFLLDNDLCFDTSFRTCEDIQFNQKAFFHSEKFAVCRHLAYLYRIQEESASQGKGRTMKVLKDQFRRLLPEVRYFVPLKDFRFLCRVLYLNIREIALWSKLSLR